MMGQTALIFVYVRVSHCDALCGTALISVYVPVSLWYMLGHSALISVYVPVCRSDTCWGTVL